MGYEPVVTPELGYRAPDEAISWLTAVLGLSRGLVITAPDGSIAHAELWWRGGVVFLEGLGSSEDQNGIATTCLVAESPAEVDRIYERTLAAGAHVVSELGDTPFGSHQFAVRDPEANVWVVGTYQATMAS